MISETDSILMEIEVLWSGWELDGTAWVMERANGERYLKMSNHGAEYEAEIGELEERIAKYEYVLRQSKEAMALLAQRHCAER